MSLIHVAWDRYDSGSEEAFLLMNGLRTSAKDNDLTQAFNNVKNRERTKHKPNEACCCVSMTRRSLFFGLSCSVEALKGGQAAYRLWSTRKLQVLERPPFCTSTRRE